MRILRNEDIEALSKAAELGYEKASEVANVIVNSDTPNALAKLFLIDRIIRNVGGAYVDLLSNELVAAFRCVFMTANKNVRHKLLDLRIRWTETLRHDILQSLDVEIHKIDSKWPVQVRFSNFQIFKFS